MNVYKPEGALIATAKNYEYISTREGLERALDGQIILEAPVIMCDHDFNLHVDLCGRIKGIIAREDVQLASSADEIKDIAVLTRVGKTVCFKVMGFEIGRSGELIARLSRRAAQLECLTNYISTLLPGDIVESRITHIEGFGAFADISCGIISLLSIDSISISRISHPSDRLRVGDYIFSVVKSIDERGRIYISERELLGTWEENAARFREGETVRGIIRSIESYGVFVELAPNLAGLAEYHDSVYPGQVAAVYIKSIIPDKMKIKLTIIDAEDSRISHKRLEYFIDTKTITHIDRWVYSPKSSKKVIETVF